VRQQVGQIFLRCSSDQQEDVHSRVAATGKLWNACDIVSL